MAKITISRTQFNGALPDSFFARVYVGRRIVGYRDGFSCYRDAKAWADGVGAARVEG